jgi:hypothetical protein
MSKATPEEWAEAKAYYEFEAARVTKWLFPKWEELTPFERSRWLKEEDKNG